MKASGSNLQSYALKGKRMNIEEAPASSRQNNLESQNSMQGFERSSTLRTHRSNTADSAEEMPIKGKSEQLIAIKIVDVDKNVVKTFIQKKDLIVTQMKYFARHLGKAANERKSKERNATNDESSKDIIDIQVSCDAEIFKFLLDCCTELHAKGKISETSSR